MRKNTSFLLVACLMTISTLIGGCSSMQNKAVNTPSKYPERPITMIVPFSAGGTMDLVARAMEKSSIKHLGQPFIIVNKPGAGGTIAWDELVKSNPDGYTFGMTGMEILMQPLYGQTKYDYLTALEPIAQIADLPMLIVVKTNQPWQNIEDLVNYSRQNPRKIKYGHAGIGTITNVIGESLKKAAGIEIEQVPFRGASEVITALLGEHVQVIVANPAVIKEHVKSGTVRVLAVAAKSRLKDPLFAQVPTLIETGLDVEFGYWFGIGAPKDLPFEVRNKFSAGIKAMMADQEFQDNINKIGVQINYCEDIESKNRWLSDSRKLSKTLQETGILDSIKAEKQ